VLGDADLPAAFRSGDLASLTGQRQALAQVRWTLWLGIIAAAAGIASWRVGEADLDVLAAVGVAAFIGALILTIRLRAQGSEARWYRGRAIAESVKTLAWRYAVGGDPFGSESTTDVDAEFVQRVKDVIKGASDVWLVPIAGEQITDAMRDLRTRPLSDRRDAYITGRVNDQEGWYTGRAQANQRSAGKWSGIAVAMNVAGVAAAVSRLVGWTDVDLLGVAAAAAGGATAWAQLRQHHVLATSYALAAQELSLVRAKLRSVTDERAWALAVSDAEEAISREHTMWLAQHGHTSL
jgi:SMODS and SLOG-associating 2TM effector domain 3/SMODS and SLOG-associating 2TM effector domain 1